MALVFGPGLTKLSQYTRGPDSVLRTGCWPLDHGFALERMPLRPQNQGGLAGGRSWHGKKEGIRLVGTLSGRLWQGAAASQGEAMPMV